MTVVRSIQQADLLTRELRELAKTLTAEQTVLVQKKLTLDLFAGVIRRTPVDEGIARGGWQIGVGNAPELKPINRNDTADDPTSTQAYQEGFVELGKLRPFQIVFISNNIPYIIVLDHGLFVPPNPGPSKDPRPDRYGRVLVEGGYSKQAFFGMVDLSIEAIRDTL